jgi:hypothetical protein
MTCEECGQRTDDMVKTLDEIRTSQVQMQSQVSWIVTTVESLAKGFQEMMNSGGILGMLKQMRSGKKDG